ncbi:F-box/LRR-repeat protein 14-like [Hordeum vulgare subsp. vulgare]|uniref:F-box domain-containing protein n=1 Tax=Hordeum vulgare subsp. vulgare TaxID=112509 RepID=A0A8I6XPQ0_HORVV|nr:F-box/LRR-repeat protein 14-like [Hordeum vulgare subsp. vulgare]KAI4992162.1 hypothetical protein ZWY2020_046654 [Hordeum vulgare]
MEDLPEVLLEEIIQRITRTSDLNSLSLVSKSLYMVEANQRASIRLGCSLFSATETLSSLCSRFSNLSKMEIDYTGQTLSLFSYIDDSGLSCLSNCKKLMSLTLKSVPSITSRGLLSVVVGCKSLSALHLFGCKKISNVEWLEYLGWNGSLEELVVRNCNRVSQCDLLKFGPGWMKLWKFEFEIKGETNDILGFNDPLYDVHNLSTCDFFCDNLKDLRLVHIQAISDLVHHIFCGKCKALEKLCLEYIVGLNDHHIIDISHNCNNLKSISLWLMPPRYFADDNDFLYIPLVTDDSLEALALGCPMLQTVELAFHEDTPYLPEIGLTLEGIRILIQSSRIRDLVLNGANFFDDEGMMVLSSSPFLETLELVVNNRVTDAGMHSIARTPCLRSLTLRLCSQVTDAGLTELVHSQKLDSLVIEGCACISLQVAQGAAKSVHYSLESTRRNCLKRI